ncbi:MAG: hypothetical protein RIT15_34, partial [Pseudomonadota bacterium]
RLVAEAEHLRRHPFLRLRLLQQDVVVLTTVLVMVIKMRLAVVVITITPKIQIVTIAKTVKSAVTMVGVATN